MFYLTLPFALVVIGVAIYAARREPHEVRWPDFFGVGGSIAVLSGLLFGSITVLQVFGLLVVALLIWHFTRARLRTFLPLLVLAVGIPYGLIGRDMLKQQAKYDQLRQEYPMESLAARVPEPRADLRTPLPAEFAAKLNNFEGVVEFEAGRTLRTAHLRALHERTVYSFVESPGFGVMRTVREVRPSAENLKEKPERPPTPGQPGSPALWGSEPFEPLADRDALYGMHASGLLDFVNPRGWGYVKGRDRVAGFLSHRFSKVPEAKTWEVQRVELVGLLKHPEPRVYLSDKLPAMADLQNAPTRPLDVFEVAGLDAVRRGEEGFAARRGDVVRFVGGIRSAKQCVECHGGERGDLLGAFSYTLRAKSGP